MQRQTPATGDDRIFSLHIVHVPFPLQLPIVSHLHQRPRPPLSRRSHACSFLHHSTHVASFPHHPVGAFEVTSSIPVQRVLARDLMILTFPHNGLGRDVTAGNDARRIVMVKKLVLARSAVGRVEVLTCPWKRPCALLSPSLRPASPGTPRTSLNDRSPCTGADPRGRDHARTPEPCGESIPTGYSQIRPPPPNPHTSAPLRVT